MKKPLHQAVQFYARGQAQEAIAILLPLAASASPGIDVLNLLAICSLQTGQPAEAEAYWQQSNAVEANADACSNLAILAKHDGRREQAEALLRQAIALNPQHADAHYNLGNLLQEQGRDGEAEKAYRQTLELRPGHAETLIRLGNVLRRQKRPDEAEDCYRQAIAAAPDNVQGHLKLVSLLKKLGRSAEVETILRALVDRHPERVDLLNDLGIALTEQKQHAAAEEVFRTATRRFPGHANSHANLGIALKDLKRYEEAEACYLEALRLQPGHASALCNLGFLQMDDRRFEAAEASLRQVLAQRPRHTTALGNLGILLHRLRRFDEAEEAYRRTLALQPKASLTAMNLAMMLLSLGRFEEAWPFYEGRYQAPRHSRGVHPPESTFPMWQGEPLAGKSILIWPEQGFGDEIQFARYIPKLKELGARHVTLVCRPPLQPLLQTLAGADEVLARRDHLELSRHDYWSFALSLPLHLRSTEASLPARLPYLAPLPERMARWQDRLPASGPRIGLVWKGSSSHRNDANRSLPSLATLRPLWQQYPQVNWISLQKGAGEDEAAAPPADQPLLHLGSDVADFADSAAIIAQLDLVICVDTAIAHLAGALGKPCWVLLPYLGTDWRWLEGRSDSPWYPQTMRLFRQEKIDDWATPVQAIAAALGDFLRPAA